MRGPVVVASGTVVLAPVTHVTDLPNYSTQLSKLSKLSSLHPAQAVAHHRVWREGFWFCVQLWIFDEQTNF